VAGAHRVPGQLAALFSCFSHAHERASGAWHAEWQALREMFVTVGGMLEQLHVALDGLGVHGEAMRANLERGQGLVMAEAVAMALAPSLGRGAAQALLKQAVVTAVERGVPLATVLADDATVRRELGSEGLAEVMAPRNYLGASAVFIDEVMARYRAWRAGRAAS
jgi:3-carboxy-cis,cis-muconate cycloisomerase